MPSELGYEIYVGYLDGKEKEIERGEEIVVEIRDRDTYERKVVRAIASKSPELMLGGEKLWVMDWVENRQPEPWSIKIIEELEGDTEVATSRSDIEQADLVRMAQESTRHDDGKYGGDGLAANWGKEEVQKYLIHSEKIKKKG